MAAKPLIGINTDYRSTRKEHAALSFVAAGYYDGSPAENARGWLDAAKNTPGFLGIMYTTWENRYDDLERFAEAAQRQ